MKKTILIPIILLTASCTNYKYSSVVKPDGSKECTIEVSSRNNVDMANLAVDNECGLSGGVEKRYQADTLRDLIELMNAMRGKNET